MRFPAGVRTVTWATAIRWSGWGLVEALLPVFMYRFTGSYIETALITGAFYACFLLTLPLAGVLADRISARGMLLTSLALYVAIGLAYFGSGLTTIVWGIILARALNGFAFSLDVIARYTYFRRHVKKERIGSAFGYLTTVANFWWIAALVASLAIVNRVELHFLFLAISVTSAAAWLLVYKRLPRDRDHQPITGTHVLASYRDMYRRMRQRGVGIWTLATLSLGIGVLGAIMTFFIPLYVYAHDANLRHVVFITGLITLPLVFARPLGSLVDKLQHKAVFLALILMIALLAAFPFVQYEAQLALAFGIATAHEVLVLALAAIVTYRVKPVRYGRAESVMQVASNVGTIFGAVLIGLFSQLFGADNVFLLLALLTIALLAGLGLRRRYLRPAISAPPKNIKRASGL